MAVIGSALVRTQFGSLVVADNDGGALKVTVYDVTGANVLVASYTLVASGVVGNPAMAEPLPNGNIVLLYITGTNTRNWRVSNKATPAAAADWNTP